VILLQKLYFKFRYRVYALLLILTLAYGSYQLYIPLIIEPLQNCSKTWDEYQKIQKVGNDPLIQNQLSQDIAKLQKLKVQALQSQNQNLEASGLLNNIIQVAQSHNLVVYEFRTPPILVEENVIKTPIELHIKGQMSTFLLFMRDIENRALIVGTERIEIESSPSGLKIHVLLNAIASKQSLNLKADTTSLVKTHNQNPFKQIQVTSKVIHRSAPKIIAKSSVQMQSSQSVKPSFPPPQIQINSISWGQNPVVILNEHGSSRICKKGDQIQNWTIIEIQKNALIFEQAGQKTQISAP
jgi:Tfp pilus assembly protein PilO